jgi:hypothetical protein
MDDRTGRLGQYLAQHPPAWAITALGPVPADPAARRDWEHRASAIGAYREMYSYTHPDDPIGPEPTCTKPDQRAAWHQAFAALGPADEPDVRGMPDGQLWLIRDTYAAETVWAPPHVGKELRLARLGADNADLSAIRAAAEAQAARKAADHNRSVRQETLAASYRAMHDLYQQREKTFAHAMAGGHEWEHATARSRYLAIAADAELCRRHPEQKIELLCSARPALMDNTNHGQLYPVSDQKISEAASWARELAAQRQAFQTKIGERRRQKVRGDDPGWGDLTQGFPAWPWFGRDAILRPPKPDITPSAKILQHVTEHDIELEAAE